MCVRAIVCMLVRVCACMCMCRCACLSTHPTIVPTPTSVSTATPATLVKSSGAELPAAMKVAPATSSDRWSFSEIASSDGTKKSSQMMARAETKHNHVNSV